MSGNMSKNLVWQQSGWTIFGDSRIDAETAVTDVGDFFLYRSSNQWRWLLHKDGMILKYGAFRQTKDSAIDDIESEYELRLRMPVQADPKLMEALFIRAIQTCRNANVDPDKCYRKVMAEMGVSNYE